MRIDKGWWFIGGCLWTISCVQVFAAPLVVSPADQDVIERRQRSLLEQAQQQRETLQNGISLSPQPLPAASLPGEACQKVQTIVFQGVEHLSWSVQEKLITPWQGRCLTMADINRLVRDTTNAYLQRGYVTSQAWLQEQDISTGELLINVSEGRVESIILEGESPLAVSMAFPHMIDGVLNLRDIEQGMEQLNRLPSQQVSIDIQPGTHPGYSKVVLIPTARRSPVSVSVGADNSGQKSTGTHQVNVSVTLDNPLRIADQWSFNATRNGNVNASYRNRSVSGSASIPYGYWLVSYQYAWNDFFQYIPFNTDAYRYQGNNQTQRLTTSRTLFRDGARKFAVDMGITHRRTDNQLAGERLAVSSPTLSSVSIGGNFSSVLGQGYLTANPLFVQGVSWLGATPDSSRQAGLPRGEFRKFTLSASYFYPLGPPLYFLTSVYGQNTPDNLYSSERISVGGQYSVRGFKEQFLTSNRGAYWRNELNWNWMTLPGLGEISLIGALDSGWVQSHREEKNGGNVTGAALGASLNGRWFNQTVTVGRPLLHPDSLQPDRWVAYWQATITL
ncbi:ShlB/FhaC/HecB family hemolysin secretion/activation protein [Serratia fonticola]|uniref:ShlB/FhaC/HecB family hemolysin secretion/activation protein n=1 Tax=Serratia fonticola TaxID=47917 RepID=UPI000A622C93|nr:ShlB/FhaC/HecB family hemolysin secretion/activation protein [Serratia fonticola]